MDKKVFSEKKLREKLKKLEAMSEKILETNGYTKEASKLLILQEMIKEQLKNESINYAASKVGR